MNMLFGAFVAAGLAALPADAQSPATTQNQDAAPAAVPASKPTEAPHVATQRGATEREGAPIVEKPAAPPPPASENVTIKKPAAAPEAPTR